MAKRDQHRARVWVWRVLLTLGLLIGLALVFNEQLKLLVVDHLGDRTMQTIDKKTVKQNEQSKGDFDFGAVKALDVQHVAKAATTASQRNAIGKLAIPSVKMALPIMKGLSNENLSTGAGTMKPDQTMGQGNYALAGHYMTNKGILFSPLKNLQLGKRIYLTDMSKVYTYQVVTKTTVDQTQVQWIDNVAGKKLVTLITCASATEGETNRIVVQGKLIASTKATHAALQVFD